jgi:hypothetical protein
MGRELRRVPLDFDWPIGHVWDGFRNPYSFSKDCEHCDGTGYGPEAKRFSDQWHGYVPFDPSETGSVPFLPSHPAIVAFAQRNTSRELNQFERMMLYGKTLNDDEVVIAECDRLVGMWNKQWCHHLEQADVDALWADGRLSDFNPDWRENHNENVPSPSAATVNEWSICSMGHDAINKWICIRAKCERLDIKKDCEHCDGGNIWPSKMHKWLEEEGWQKIEPPTGDGYQVWETVSEGSPVSPVFTTEDELINWLTLQGYTEGAAEQFAKHGHAFSMVMTASGRIAKDIQSLDVSLD